MSKMLAWLRILGFIGVAVLITILFVVLPRDVATPLFSILVILPIFGIIIYMIPRWLPYIAKPVRHLIAAILNAWSMLALRFDLRDEQYQTNLFRFRYWHIVEVVVIIGIALVVTRHHFDFDPSMRVRGHELEWLTGYGEVARQGLEETGVIPLWNPYYRHGEPLIDNAFSYILNPFSSLPHLIWGTTQGTKYSIAIHALLAGFGGWFLGWVLGLTGFGRLMLAILLMSRGNMHANFDAGYYQLATQQVYFPWVIAGTIALIKTPHRWAIVLTALSLTLMFFAGNLWHLLPTLISIVVVVLVYLWRDGRIQVELIKRVIGTGVLTVGLSAIVLFSIASTFGLIENHLDELRAGWEMRDPQQAFLLPFIGDYDYASEDLFFWIRQRTNLDDMSLSRLGHESGLHFFYSYVVPWWFVVIILLPLPLMRAHRDILTDHRRLWLAGIGLYILFTMWGMGGTPLFVWLYEHVPHLGQWRFVPRAFATASFWIAVLVALRSDALMRLLLQRWTIAHSEVHSNELWNHRYTILFAVFVGLSCVAMADVSEKWQESPLVVTLDDFDTCLTWLSDTEDEQYIGLWVFGYRHITQFINHDIRVVNIEADYLPSTFPNTVGDSQMDARQRFTEYRFRSRIEQGQWFALEGYEPIADSPEFQQFDDCMYRNDDYELPYAFTFDTTLLNRIEIGDVVRNPDRTNLFFDVIDWQPVEAVVRQYDTIAVRAQSNAETSQLLVIQELAFPGWEVWVDGVQQDVEIFAKLNAVRLPSDGEWHEVVFLYRPQLVYWGGIATLLTALGSIVYLLNVDRWIGLWRR